MTILKAPLLVGMVTASFLFSVGCSKFPKKETPAEVPSGPIKEEVGEKPAVPQKKLGLIFGPGGLKTGAFIGFLKELDKTNIRVYSTAGLEWGALVGALYASKGRAHHVEWQYNKVGKEHLPEKNILAPLLVPAKYSRLAPFVESIFNDERAEDGRIAFSCPSRNDDSGKVSWWSVGRYKDLIKKCLPAYPLYAPEDGWTAAPFELKEAAKKLREDGAEIIVFLNPIQRGRILKPHSYQAQGEIMSLWWEGRARFAEAEASVDMVVDIYGRDYDVGSLTAVPSFMMFGQQAGKKAIPHIEELLGL